jgi:YhcH/YjgK/YiaL family protein
MIIDRIENAEKYSCLGERFARAFQLMKTTQFAPLAPGRYEVDGANLYYMVQEYKSKPLPEGRVEAHRQYADIQLVVSGHEYFGYGDLSTVQPGEYSTEKDILFANGPVDMLTLRAGFFIVLLPNDAHMPGMRIRDSEPVKKVVFKVKL